MTACGGGASPYLEGVAGSSVTLRLSATNPDGTATDLTGALVEMRVAPTPGVSPIPTAPATYSTASGSIAISAPTTGGVFLVRTSPTVDPVAGYFRYMITVTPSGGTPYVLAHGVYAVAQP